MYGVGARRRSPVICWSAPTALVRPPRATSDGKKVAEPTEPFLFQTELLLTKMKCVCARHALIYKFPLAIIVHIASDKIRQQVLLNFQVSP